MSDLNQNTKELAELVAPHVNVADGKINFDSKAAVTAVFDKLEVKEKELKKAYESVTAFNNAARLAIGEAAIEYMAKDKEVAELATKYIVAGEKVNVVTRREKHDRNPQTGAVTTTHGAVSISRTVKGSPSENKSIKEHLAAIGAKKLA